MDRSVRVSLLRGIFNRIMAKDKDKKVKKPEIDPNDYPDYGDFLKAKKEAEAKK